MDKTRQSWTNQYKEVHMYNQELVNLLGNTPDTEHVTQQQVEEIVKRARPEWQLLMERMQGGFGPVYGCSVTIDPGNIVLGIIVSACNEFIGKEYADYQWQLLVRGGGNNDTLACIRSAAKTPFKPWSIFQKAHQQWTRLRTLDGPPSVQRTLAAVELFLE